jgi:hypothetical protein
MASSERGERVAKSFTASSLWWWMVDCLFMAAKRIRERGDDLTERKLGGVEEPRCEGQGSPRSFTPPRRRGK